MWISLIEEKGGKTKDGWMKDRNCVMDEEKNEI
jgi:hypothetical protein